MGSAKGGVQGLRSFKSFDALKAGLGSPGKGKVWHHIVEQRLANRFGDEAVHNSFNVIAVPCEVNQRIANYYSGIQSFTAGKTVREWIGAQSYKEQYEFGLKVVERALAGKPLP